MISLQRAQALFETVNVAGRASAAAAKPSRYLHAMVGRAAAVQARGGRVTAADRLVMDAAAGAAAALLYSRATLLVPPKLVNFVALAGDLRWAPLFWPECELLVGRGRPAPEAMARPAFHLDEIQTWFDYGYNVQQRASADGLLGLLLERAPLAAASRLAATGHLSAAAACTLGAVAGRVVLTPLRLAVVAFAAVNSVLKGLGIAALAASFDATAWTLQRGLAITGLDQIYGTRAIYGLATEWREMRGALPLRFEGRPADDLADVVDDGGPGLTGRVTARANAAMRRFSAIDPDAPDVAAQVTALADQVAEELRRYCVNAPDPQALRWGLAQLEAFVTITFDGVDWTAPAIDGATA